MKFFGAGAGADGIMNACCVSPHRQACAAASAARSRDRLECQGVPCEAGCRKTTCATAGSSQPAVPNNARLSILLREIREARPPMAIIVIRDRIVLGLVSK